MVAPGNMLFGPLETLCATTETHCGDPLNALWEPSEIPQWVAVFGLKRNCENLFGEGKNLHFSNPLGGLQGGIPDRGEGLRVSSYMASNILVFPSFVHLALEDEKSITRLSYSLSTSHLIFCLIQATLRPFTS